MSGLRIRVHRVPCPFCGKLIPEGEIDEHIKKHVEEETATGLTFDVKPGEMIKVVYGRYAWYVLVTSVRMAPIIQGRDVYGNEVRLDLRKAMMVVKLTPEQAQEVLRRAYQRRKKKRAEAAAKARETAEEAEKREKQAEEVEKSEEPPEA